MFDPDVDDLDQNIDLDPTLTRDDDHDESLTPDEKLEQGFYNVSSILKHKFQQGWRFLTHWEGFPVSASTWEPIRSFTLPQGRINSKFQEYCLAKGLTGILNQALKQ
jgi:hypothetical protein